MTVMLLVPALDTKMVLVAVFTAISEVTNAAGSLMVATMALFAPSITVIALVTDDRLITKILFVTGFTASVAGAIPAGTVVTLLVVPSITLMDPLPRFIR